MKNDKGHVIGLALLLVISFLAGPVAASAGGDEKAAAAQKLDLSKLNLSDLNRNTMGQVGEQILATLAKYGLQALGALAIFVIGRWLAKMVSGLAARALTKAKVDPTLVPFIENLAYVILLVLVIIAALERLNVPMTSAVTIVGAAGLAIGLAWQGSLSNLAAGVLLLVFKPFKVGDFIQAAGAQGTVKAIHIFNTILNSPDNVKIVVPNAQVTGGSISNFTANGTRRVDLTVSVSYDDDLKKAQRVIEGVLSEDKRILAEPASEVSVSELADTGVKLVVRPWVKSADYWAVHCDVTAKIKMAFDENGITCHPPPTT